MFEGSTQLVSPEDTNEVKDSFWTTMNMDPEEFIGYVFTKQSGGITILTINLDLV